MLEMRRKKHKSNGPRLSAVDRKCQLERAALRVFSEKGFCGSTTKEIAEAAGVSEAVIYQHFETKEELYASVLDENTSRIFSGKWISELKKHAERRDDEGLFNAVGEKITEFAGQTCLVRLVLYSTLERHELAQFFRQKQMLPVFTILRNYIISRQKDGVFQAGDPNLAARAFFGAQIYHAVVENLFQGASLEISNQAAVKDFTRLSLNALRHRPVRNETKIIF